MICRVFVASLALLPLAASGQTIYKCVDAQGGTTYSSTKIDKNCKVIASSPEHAQTAPASGRSRTALPSPAGFPRVQEDTQRTRDGDRRHILEQELASEQRQLDQARKALAELEVTRGGAGDRAAPYRDRVGQHERNVQAIQKELNNLR